MKQGHIWLVAGISAVALVLAFRQVDLGQLGAAFARVDYGLVVAAAGIQLLTLGAIAGRWGLLFRERPPFGRLLGELQIGAKVLPAPLGGIGVFQYTCVEALALFGVGRELALSYGFVLHFVVFVPGIVLGGLALYRAHFSLRRLKEEAQDSMPPPSP
jgi:uncharacterized membrane protein YbhN (UPF0104 family)